MLKKLFAVLLTLFILINITACEKDKDAGKIGEMPEINEENPFASPFSGKADMFRIDTTENEKINYAYSGNKIPETFPKELPVYSPASVTSCKILENNKGAIAVLHTLDTPDKIAEFYINSAQNKGWTKKDELLTEKMFYLMAKNDSSIINISATEGTNGTAITLAISLNTDQ